MGNRTSSEPTMVGYSSGTRTDNVYEPPRYPHQHLPSSLSHGENHSPPLPPRDVRRSMTMSGVGVMRRQGTSHIHPGMRRLSASDFSQHSPAVDLSVSDDLAEHIVENRPKDSEIDVPLGTTITVTFDHDVKSVNINKLFEVTCNSVDPSLNPVKGRISYDSRQMRAEFIPSNTLFPNAQYTVKLMGWAVTTKACSHSANIKSAELRFHTCSPAPKQIGIKLKGHVDEPETIQIADYYDLYNSLIVWSTRKWGCSGEHVTGMYTENEDGKLQPLKADLDVLNLRENEVVVVEIKD